MKFLFVLFPLVFLPIQAFAHHKHDLSVPGHVHKESIEFINCDAVRYLNPDVASEEVQEIDYKTLQ